MKQNGYTRGLVGQPCV